MVGSPEGPSEAWAFHRWTGCCRSQPSQRVFPNLGLGCADSQSCQGPAWYLQQDVQVGLLWNEPLAARRMLACRGHRVQAFHRVLVAKVRERFQPCFRAPTRMGSDCHNFCLE